MRVFVYEYITAGGTFRTSTCDPNGSLLAEGRAMLTAVATDFAELPDVSVTCLWDNRLPNPNLKHVQLVSVGSAESESELFRRHAASCDFTLVIAPEFNRELLTRAMHVERVGGQLLGPDPRFIRLTSSKRDTIEHLRRAGVRVPRTLPFDDRSGRDMISTLVVKPDDGAGSIGVRRLETSAIDTSVMNELEHDRAICLQQYCEGRAASMMVLCGRRSTLFPACWQNVQPPDFEYCGGSLILDPDLRARASDLVESVVDSLPETRGMFGVDLVLGTERDGSTDFAIEVNPRLTTSYVGLRRMTAQNLAHAMLAAQIDASHDLSFRLDPLEFLASGEVRRLGARLRNY